MEAALSSSCIFCKIARSSTSTTLLHQDDKVVAFQDINPSAFRWKAIKYTSLGPFGGFIEAGKLLERLKPLSSL